MRKLVSAALVLVLLGMAGVFLGCSEEESPAVPEQYEEREALPEPEESEQPPAKEEQEQDQDEPQPLPVPAE
ncbi:MAG: hypothetical protein ACLFWL_08205 [Candidatus Brocadiia bacterium]